MRRVNEIAPDGTVEVWDRGIRIGHWILVAAFAIAWVSEGDPEWLHAWSGYLIGIVVILRVLWGVIGPQHARFSDFVAGPTRTLAYLRALVSFRAKRHLGHSPAGGAMTVALLVMLALSTLSGMAALAADRGRGPLAGAIAQVPATQTRSGGEHEGGRSLWSGVHALTTDVAMILIVLHLGGVALASIAHRENLARSMVTGRKRL